jgi:hypothetical protein
MRHRIPHHDSVSVWLWSKSPKQCGNQEMSNSITTSSCVTPRVYTRTQRAAPWFNGPRGCGHGVAERTYVLSQFTAGEVFSLKIGTAGPHQILVLAALSLH